MSKRARHTDTTDSRPPKRPRPEPSDNLAAEEIHFARQLQDLLAFRQDALPQLRKGIASFKAFLESILYHKDPDDRARQLSILREYLDTQRPADPKDVESEPFLAPLWQALSFALSTAAVNEALASAIVSLLALSLKTLSSLLDFGDFGLLLCRTVLQSRHLGLVRRCLEAPRQKEFLIGPAIRLLGEVVGFDGGVVVRESWRRREVCLGWGWVRKALGMGKVGVPPEELQRRPAIRTLTVRYILSFLKYLHEGGKADLLQNGALCRALFQGIREDPAELVSELLTVTEQHVFKDDELQRSAKAAVLAQQNLERVTSIATQPSDTHPAADKAFQWLKAVSTKPSYGVLRHSGWYPPGTTHLERQRPGHETIDLGLDSLDFYDREDRPLIRNTVLLSWIQTLHPWSNLKERELVLTCFCSAPELIAAYFVDKERSMHLEPKLSNTWIGYASFLFEVVQLPVPERLGHGKDWAQLPPQANIMIESILPRPLTQKVLSRCLNQSSELITFFAVRVLLLAMQKLRTVQHEVAKGAETSERQPLLWEEASHRLLERFIDQAPPMKDIIGAFRKIPDDDEHALQREAVTRLLRLCYEITPLQALEEQFDVSGALTAALSRAREANEKTQMIALRALELEHLLQIARRSPGMRWFGKQGGLPLSPAITLLQLHAREPRDRAMRDIVTEVLQSSQAIDRSSDVEALVATLHEPAALSDSVVWEFLDDCLTRATKKPVKYLDDLERTSDVDGAERLPLLSAVSVEQALFLLKKDQPKCAMRMNEAFLVLIGEINAEEGQVNRGAGPLLEQIRRLDEWADHGFTTKKGKALLREWLHAVRILAEEEVTCGASGERAQEEVAVPFDSLPIESENHPELLKWAQKDLFLALEDGDISALILCLCSQYPDIRTQALSQLQKLEDRLLTSSLEDKDPLYVLLGELIETYERNYLLEHRRLEYIGGCFVTAALKVQMDPTHFLYPKLNAFLNKDPEWRIPKLPTYWITHTLLSTPDPSALGTASENDRTYWLEARWVLDWLTSSLRTRADLDILRRAGVFERFMALFSAPGCERGFRDAVLGLLWRAMEVEGGTGVLVKRCGVLAWLDAVKPSRGGVEGMVRRRVLEGVEGEGLEGWAGVGLEEM